MAAKKKKVSPKFNPGQFIEESNWKQILKVVKTLTEEDLQKLIDYEKDHKNRSQYLSRFHQRFNKLRAIRERKDLAIF